ncbi:MAG: hypothetical protein QXK06_00040, partial [Candidatus Diapherotrites archaeon]
DAVQFSAFLAKKLLQTAKSAQDKMQSKNFNAEAFGCPQTFCSFATLGLSAPEYTVYLMNDFVSAEAIQNGLADEAKSLSSYAVSFRAEEFDDILSKTTSFSPFNIYMNKPMQGCGRYKIKIKGAVQNASNALQKDNLILYVQITEDRKVTPECTNKIQNMMNFLPVDTGLTSSRTLASWLGMVQTDEKLQKVGEDFATTLFGSSKGRVAMNTTSNKLHLLLKELETGTIMKLSIGQVSETDAKPNTITLELNAMFDQPDELVRNEIATKAKEGLKAMAQGAFALDACIGEREDYLMISKFEKLGELTITGPTEMAVYYDMKNCIKLKAQGTIKGEKIALKTSFNDIETANPQDKAGIKAAWIEIEESGTTKKITEYSATETGTPIALAPVAGKEGLNEKEFLLCAEGDNGQVFQAIGKKLKVKAKSVSIPMAKDTEGEIRVREMTGWHEVKISTCGMHPYAMLKKISEQATEVKKSGKKIEAYTVLVWKGDPEELTLKSMIAAWRAHKLKQTEGEEDEEGKTMEQKIARAKTYSLWVYLGACSGMNLACNLLTKAFLGLPIALPDILFNCGIPTIAGFFGPQISGAFGGLWEKIKTFFTGGPVDEWADAVQEGTTGQGDGGTQAEATEDDLLTGAFFGISFRGLTRFIAPSNRGAFTSATAAQSAIKETAESIAEDATKRWADSFIKGAVQEDALRSALKSDLETRLTTRLTRAAEEAARKGSFKIANLGLDDAANAAWAESSESMVRRIAADPSVVKNSVMGSRLQKAISGSVDDLIDSSTIAQRATKNLSIKPGAGNMYQNPASMVDELTTKTMSELDDLLRANPQLRSQIEGALRKQLSERLGSSTAMQADDLTRVVNQSINNVKAQYADDLFSATRANIDDQVRAMFESRPAASTEVPRGGRIKNFIARLKDPRFWKTLGRGIVCGAISNLAGLVAKQWFLNYYLGELHAEAEAGLGFDFTGPLSNYEGSEVFRKFKPYKITIDRKENGNVRVSIEDLTVETDGESVDEKLKAMGEAIAKDPASYWKEDCEGQLKQGIDELIGCLAPDAESEGVTTKQVLAYYANNADIAANCFSENPEQRLDEALLMAVLLTKPENISNCCIEGGECIKSDWYEASKGERQRTIGCAATQLRRAMSAGSPEETVKSLALNLEGENLENYAREVLKTYNVWRKFDICSDGS